MSPTYSDVELSDQALEDDSDISRVSFRPDYSDSDKSDADKAPVSTTQTSPEPSRSPKHYDGVSRSSKPSVRGPVRSRNLLDFSDDPDDDTDEDIANIPLDYGRSEKTKVRGVRIEQRWISPEDSEEINVGIRKLINKFGLNQQERGKELVYVQDLTELNETILRTQERRFHFGYERIQMCLFSMIGIYTVNRLSALLSLQLKHLQFSIQKDPHGGPPVLLVEIRLEHTKRFLGSEAINTFAFPKIIDDPSLIFSPHVFIFGILFWLQAFKSPALSSIEKLRSLFVQGGRQQMPLPLKPEVEDRYIFCKTEVVNGRPILR
ncbi:hypothetical protein N7474_010694 [Penicillium riverlandense]|uniref:uncharacterized protein n=1 Tax=Penicillium riverlandense TaxID=1903569 RepID=UPI0025466906|nr:uncharacterized protein N7474_010716 [Penicillium riverlandense]XP_057048375.1 uncharacterized protein N7474_010694 [Penicillium riverlandense]KAJ5804829.1 hypothetical protein N7474_010716 [Penicillium riverlandense]KAJ5807102.1 hypothetical protein N7474_010694 [Penicillium riverlandense]